MSVSNHLNIQYSDLYASEPEKKTEGMLIPFFFILGMAIISAPIFIGDSYIFSALVLFISFFVTALGGNYPISWIFLASILAANPGHMYIFPSNLIFAIWLMMFNMRYVLDLPKWVYLPTFFAILAFICSSINWSSVDIAKSILLQTRYMLNYLMGPLFLLPIIYFRMGKSRDNVVNLKGLLFYLIIPSTLILFIAYCFGTPIQSDDIDLQLLRGLIPSKLKLGNTVVNFYRTCVGFILSSFICASIAIIVSRVKTIYRLLAALCLILNFLLLLFTGSVGSTLACLCGLAAIFYTQYHMINRIRFLISTMVIVCLFFLVWNLSPVRVKNYVEKRYQDRIVNNQGMNTDRFILWGIAINYLYEHPEGVGWTLTVGDIKKSNPHNDYLVYAISYGIVGGMVYAYLVLRLLIYFFRKSKTIIKDPYEMAVTLAGLGVVVVVFVNSMTDHMVVTQWYFYVIWSIIWYCFFCSQNDYSNSLKRNNNL